MKNKLFAILLCLPILLSCGFSAYAESAESYTVAQVQDIGDGILAYKERQNGAGGVQELIDGYLCDTAGISAEFYAIAISQAGSYRWGSYERALLDYLSRNDVSSASSRLKYALALCAVGSSDKYITDAADEAIGGLGVMSLVFGLHLLNNGYPSALYSTDGLIGELLSYQKPDGGWAVMGSYGDVDVTAMTVQALAPHYYSRGDVRTAVDAALKFLSARQLSSGGIKTMGAENSESAAQVVIALSALGIDAQTDSRFIKNGVTPLSALLRYRCSDGSFAHTNSSNETATMEAYCAVVAYLRFIYGQGSLYLLDRSGVPDPEPAKQRDNKNSGQGGSRKNHQENGGADSADDPAEYDPEYSGEQDSPQNSSGGTAGSSDSGARKTVDATDAAGEPVTAAIGENATEMPQKPSYGGFQPAATGDERHAATADEGGKRGGYKLYVILGVLAAAGGACLVLYLLKKRGKKHYIAVGIIAAAGVLFILLTDFESPDSYRQTAQTGGDLTVTLSIRCDTIADREKVNDHIPDDGVILDTTELTLSEGATVYDALLSVVKEYGVPMDNRGAQGAAYIAGLNYLYEFDYGELSGWMYRVNGTFPDVGCQSYTVSDGDKIEWLYTTNIGKDLE